VKYDSDSLWAGKSGDRSSVGARFSAHGQTGLGAHPSSSRSSGLKRPGRGVDHPPYLASRLKKELSFTATPPLGLHDLLWG